MIVLQMGGGQIDSSPLVNNPNISALLWGGYPGQDGGVALFDIITGKAAPAGRLPTTQYPASYIHEVPMSDMSLRPGPNNPGRTYKWYNGTAVFEFGSGLHYTNFTAQIQSSLQQRYSISTLLATCRASNATYLDRCPFSPSTLEVTIGNTGNVSSDYVTLLFLAGSFGPAPYPKKSLVAYQRLFSISPQSTSTANLNLTLGSLARVDEQGNKVLYPGDYALMIDIQPMAMANFTLTGDPVVLDEWPQPPKNRKGSGVEGLEGYFAGGYGGNMAQETVS
jgi:beta-D-xylosidase 4